MSHRTFARSLGTTALFALLVSCAADTADERRYGLDETLECPDGYVGWNFQTHPPRTLSSQLQSEAGLLPSRDTLEIASVVCGDDAESLESREATNQLRGACSGDESCSETVQCSGAVTISYDCGETDPDDEGAVLVREASLADGDARTVALSCARELEPEVLPERSACVPRFCHGQERRDEALNCVPDATIPEVILPKVGRATFTPTRFDPGSPDSRTLQMGASYDFDAMLYFEGTEDTDVPENARATVWLADRFVGAGGEVHAFRCVLGTLDAGRDRIDREREPQFGRTGVHLELTQEIPAGCTHHDDLASVGGVNPSVEADLERRANVVRNDTDPNRYTPNASDDPNAAGSYGWSSTRVFVSYDMEGNTAAAPLGTDHVCAPNPPSFYWDAEDEAFDLWGYLNQRILVRWNTLGRPAFDSTHEFGAFVYPPVIHVGPTDFTVRTASVGVTSLPNRSPSVAVDIGWYRDNDPPTNVSPYTFNREGAGLDYTAKVFLWPADRVGERLAHPEIASVPLNGVPATTGSVVSRDIELSASTRQLFYDPSSALYVDPAIHGNSRAYHIGYCIKSSDTANGRLFTPYGAASDGDRLSLVSSTGNRIELRTRDQYSWRSQQPPPLDQYRTRVTSGCLIASTPLMVTVDRLNRSQIPVGNSDFSGQATNRTSGDARMSGSSDSDSERACLNDDGTPDPTGQSCRETQSGAAMGAGNLGRSFYSYDLDLTRMNQSAQAAMSGNILGFMAIDPMMDGNSGSATPAPGDETTPVTLTLTPPWNTIRDALNTLTGTPPGSVLKQQWQTGRYAGIDGLGLAIGYKQKIQIGPIPGEIILSASAGVGLAAIITLQAAPSAADAYPCIGSSQCVQVASEQATLEAAALDCYVRGGRLAEPSSAAEGAALQAATSAHGAAQYWSGAQLAYYHPNPQCLGDGFNRARCMAAMRTSYRWLSDDDELANRIGTQAVSYTPPSTTSVSELWTQAPNAAGLLYAPGSQTLAAAPASRTAHYACAFDPADTEIFFRSSVGLKVSAGAGISLQFCVPSEDFGFCLEGTLNFVTLALQPTVTRTDRILFGGGSAIAYRGHTRREVPWSLTVLDGAIYAKANFYFASFSWPIVTFPGFRVAGGYLVDPIDTAVHRGLL